MNKGLKIVVSVIIVLILLWVTIFYIDYLRCGNFKEPIFVIAKETADDGGSGIYYGLGYRVKIEKTISNDYGPTLVRVEMYVFDKFITGAISDINDSSPDKNYDILEEEQYDFTAIIIGVYENSIMVEPDEGTKESKSSDKITMSIPKNISGNIDLYKIGGKVKVTYNGVIMESYPAQIFATKIELLL